MSSQERKDGASSSRTAKRRQRLDSDADSVASLDLGSGAKIELCTGLQATGDVVSCLTVPSMVAIVIFTVLSLLGQVGVTIALPIFADAVIAGGKGDPYFVLFSASGCFAVAFFIWLNFLKLFTNQITPVNSTFRHRDMFLVGLCNSLNGLMVVFASPTTRTAAFLQALLTNFSIPMTIGVRWLILRRSINGPQALCALTVVLGIFTALAPTIFQIDQKPTKDGATGIARILWPLCFMMGFLPYALMNVLQEKGLKTDVSQHDARSGSTSSLPGVYGSREYTSLLTDAAADAELAAAGRDSLFDSSSGGGMSGSTARSGSVNSPTKPHDKTHVHIIYWLAWISVYQFICIAFLFWTDMLPGFGAAGSPSVFADKLTFGFRCVALQEPSCTDGTVLLKALLFVVCYTVGALGTGLLSRHPEGANFVALVQTLVTPLAGLWWTLFQADPFEWHPEWLTTSYFSVGGLALMIPGIVLYQKYSDAPGSH